MSIEIFLEKFSAGRLALRRCGLLCNQTAFSHARGRYLFEILAEAGVLRRLFLPEHGLFAELQDQIGLDLGPGAVPEFYRKAAPGAEFVSLYGTSEQSLAATPDMLRDLDALIVDVQDVGARYYTFATTVSYVFDTLARHGIDLRVIVIERPNPAGRLVEGTVLPETYQSFVGRPGVIHRHGLTIGELCRFFRDQVGGTFELEVVYDPAVDYTRVPAFEIPPSPNMPSPFTPRVYSGQCLLEGTNLSEGRGNTRPFEIFGAPFLDGVDLRGAPVQTGATLRPLRFIPTFHKWAGETCAGFQIHLHEHADYHSLAHTLKMLRWCREERPDDFAWRTEEYEFRSDRPAIEILAGDELMLAYLDGEGDVKFADVREKMRSAETAWIEQVRPFLIHKESSRRMELDAAEDYR